MDKADWDWEDWYGYKQDLSEERNAQMAYLGTAISLFLGSAF